MTKNKEEKRRHLLADAVNVVAGKAPSEARLLFSQGAIHPSALAQEISNGRERGTDFYRAFETVRRARKQSFSKALKELVETPLSPAPRRPT